MSWISVGIGVVSLGVGIYQTVDGNNKRKKAEKNRPDYTPPSEAAKNVNLAEQIAYEGLPAASKQQFNREIQRQQATMLSSQGAMNAQLSGLAGANVAAMDATSRLYSQDANMRREGRMLQMEANKVAAQYKDRDFAYDHQFYQQDLDTANALVGAGMQNMAGGAGMIASGAGNANFKKKQKPPPSGGFEYADGAASLTNQLNSGGTGQMSPATTPQNYYDTPINNNPWENQGDFFLYG